MGGADQIDVDLVRDLSQEIFCVCVCARVHSQTLQNSYRDNSLKASVMQRVSLSHQLFFYFFPSPLLLSSFLTHLMCFLLIFPGLSTSQRQRTHSTIQP